MTQHFLIIGGSDAGISAALRARELSSAVEITMLLADDYPNFSICGIPFFLSGEVPDWRNLAHRTRADIEAKDIRVLTNTQAEKIDPDRRSVMVRSREGNLSELPYDKLLIGTGARSNRPPIPGLDLPGVFTLRWMDEARAISAYLTEHNPTRVLLVGGGYINMELCDAFERAGLHVTLVEHHRTVLKTVDASFGEAIGDRLASRNISVRCGRRVVFMERSNGNRVEATLDDGSKLSADLVIVAAGARPETQLAVDAGAGLGVGDAIRVNERMETSLPDVFAAGDCAETWHALVGRPAYLPLGTTAHKQGRVAGENALGGFAEYQGSLGTQVVRVFDLVVSRTGLKDSDAKVYGFDPLTTESKTWDHKVYYPGAKELRIRLTGDRRTGALLGAQLLGETATETAKRIDTVAALLHARRTVADLIDQDLSYTPPLGSPWDPLQQAAMDWLRAQHSSNLLR